MCMRYVCVTEDGQLANKTEAVARKCEGKRYVRSQLQCIALIVTTYNTTTFSERHYLVFWETEGKVSVHNDVEVKEPGTNLRRIGANCSVLFGCKLYDGKIANVGKYITVTDRRIIATYRYNNC